MDFDKPYTATVCGYGCEPAMGVRKYETERFATLADARRWAETRLADRSVFWDGCRSATVHTLTGRVCEIDGSDPEYRSSPWGDGWGWTG